jgi:phage shock protein PspC (stress-responsive transcriptional regulator)
MNKTVSVNINGYIFNIEDTAFDKLNRYLNTIRGYFSESAGAEEIIEDIEARIAELFQEKITDNYQVIKLKDVDEIIVIMGEPEVYIDEEIEFEEKEERKEEAKFRKEERKIRNKYRRLYRDPDNNVIGGVSAGIGHYFGIDPIWIRLLFILLVLGGGSGVLIYIVLWIIIPMAKTAAEKLEMYGDPVTAENIGRMVTEEYGNLKKKFSPDKEEIRNTKDKVGNAFQDFFSFLGKLLHLLVASLGKIFGFIFVFTGLLGVVALIFGVLGTGEIFNIISVSEGMEFSFHDVMVLLAVSPGYVTWIYVVSIFLLGIPLIALVYLGFGLLTDFSVRVRGFGLALFIIWLVFSVIGVALTGNLARNYVNENEVKEVYELGEIQSDTLSIVVLPDTIFESEWNGHFNDLDFIEITDDRIFLGSPILDIVRSPDDQFRVVVNKESRGRTRRQAKENAKDIEYSFLQIGSIISFSPFYSLTRDNGYHFDEVQIKLMVPEGKAIELSEGTERIIYDIENVTDTWDRDMIGKIWTMTEDGLECIGCDSRDL